MRKVRDLINLGYEIHKKTGENNMLYTQQFLRDCVMKSQKKYKKAQI